jgi:hypothetical protein
VTKARLAIQVSLEKEVPWVRQDQQVIQDPLDHLVHPDHLAQEVNQGHPGLPVTKDHQDLTVLQDLLDQLVSQDQLDRSDHQEMQGHRDPMECKERLEYKDFLASVVQSVTPVLLVSRDFRVPLDTREPQASQDL